MTDLHRSLFGRLFLIFVITVLAYALVVAMVLSELIKEHPRNQFSQRLLSRLIERLGDPPSPTAMAQLADELKVSLVVSGPDLLWRSDGRLPSLERLVEAAAASGDFDLTKIDGRNVAVLRSHGRIWFVTGFAVPLSAWAKGWLAGGAVTLLLLAFANYRAVRWLFGPIRGVHRAAESIAAGDLGYRLPVGRSDEIGRLTASINAMAERIQAMLDGKRNLLLAISHEIRSPLARARVAIEMTPEGKARERVTTALEDINRLVGALLQAETLDGTAGMLRLDRADLRDIVRGAVRDAADVRIRLHLPESAVVAEVDTLRVGLLVANLLSNALRHGGDGPVTLTLDACGDVAVITVADTGPGIAPQHLPRLCEPFYRPDASRSRGTGGHGLGLYLCRQIATAHNGRLDIASIVGSGTTVTAVLPLRHDHPGAA